MNLNEALRLACIKYGYPYDEVYGVIRIRRGGVNGRNKVKWNQEKQDIQEVR